jgi:hypothetical protein
MKAKYCLFIHDNKVTAIDVREHKGKLYLSDRLVKNEDVSTLYAIFCKLLKSKKFKELNNTYSVISKDVTENSKKMREAIDMTHKVYSILKKRFIAQYENYCAESIEKYGVICYGYLNKLADMVDNKVGYMPESIDTMLNTNKKPVSWEMQVKACGLDEDCTFEDYFSVYSAIKNQEFISAIMSAPKDCRALTVDGKMIPIIKEEGELSEVNDEMVALHEDIKAYEMTHETTFIITRNMMKNVQKSNELVDLKFNFHILIEDSAGKYLPIIINAGRDPQKILVHDNVDVESLTETNHTYINIMARMNIGNGTCYRTIVRYIIPDDKTKEPYMVSNIDMGFLAIDISDDENSKKKSIGYKYCFDYVVGLTLESTVKKVDTKYFSVEDLIGLVNSVYKVYTTRRKSVKSISSATVSLRNEIRVSTRSTTDNSSRLIEISDVDRLVKNHIVYAPHKVHKHHASPRKHFRRGYIRHYKNGKEVFINSTWVNSDKETVNYRVKEI